MHTGRTETALSPEVEVTSSFVKSSSETWRTPAFRIAFALCVATLTAGMLVHPVSAYPYGDNEVRPAPIHHLSKRSFFDINCKGVYDKSIFARLDRICEDCYNLFREPQLHSLCKKDCFTSDYFEGCMEALQLKGDTKQVQTWIKQLHGADPGVLP